MSNFKIFFASVFTIILSFQSQAQERVLLDEVLAVVGKNAIYKSDIQNGVKQLQLQGAPSGVGLECYVFEEKLFEKLLVHKAEVDSIAITDNDIDDAINRRMEYMLMRLGGSEVKFQEVYGKTVLEFKKEIRGTVADNLLATRVKGEITSNVSVSPEEVRTYFNSLPKDSLPVVPESYKLAQLVVKAKANGEEKRRVKRELEGIRKRIVNGSDFDLQARIYSEDPGTRDRGGDLGFLARTQLVPEFSAVAFKLEPGEISPVIESPFGFHIIQLIEKKGKLIHARHILKIPKVYNYDLDIAKKKADSIVKVIKNGANFNKLASDLSDDEQSKVNGGIVRNPNTGGEFFEVEDLDKELYVTVQQLEEGDFTEPELYSMRDNSTAYRIIYLMEKENFHMASIETDYDRIKAAALEAKKEKAFKEWIAKGLSGTYIKLPEIYKACEGLEVWYEHETIAKTN